MATLLMSIGTPDFTGGPRMALTMARALKAARHRVIVVSGKRPPLDQGSVLDPMRAEGIETIEESGFHRQCPDRNLIRRISSLVVNEQVKCLISEQQQDFRIMPFVARRTNVKLIYHVQNPARFSGNALTQTLKRRMYKRLVTRNTAKLICVSEAVRSQHIAEFGVSRSQVVVADNGIDLSQYQPISEHERHTVRTEIGIKDGELMLLNVGRLSLQKGQDMLLRAVEKADFQGRPFKLALVGAATCGYQPDIQYEANLRHLAESPALQNRVLFLGWRNDVPRLLRASDIYLHSANWEGMPLAVLEAMSAELPCISTDCAGTLKGFVQGVHGSIVPTGDVIAFQQAIEQFANLPKDRRVAIGRSAATLVATHFNIEKSASHFVSLVEQFIKENDQVLSHCA